MNNGIKIEAIVTGKFSYAMQQNCIPPVRVIRLVNESAEDAANITVKAVSDPPFSQPFEQEVPVIAAGRSVEITPVKIAVSAAYLFALTEKEAGNIRITAEQDGETVAAEDIPVEILAYDQWSGSFIMPELLSAFTSPNHPAISNIISKAGAILREWTGSPSFTGYQSEDPNIVKKQAAAIYTALCGEGIAYTMPPADFEKNGQRVRMPFDVLSGKMGTCIDLTLLYASCLEQIWLNPLIILIGGHCFAGFWLEDETFADCVEDDVSAVRKRTAEGIDKICVVECTDFTAGSGKDFAHAEKHALDALEDPGRFRYAIDVRRCRGSGIRPIPARTVENGEYKAVSYSGGETVDTSEPRLIDTAKRGGFAEGRELTKQMIWERKLLDLSLRNSLLNFRPSVSNVQFMTADLAKLEDEISDGESFRIMPAPTENSFTLTDSKMYEIENERDLITSIAESEFKNHRLRTFIREDALEKTLKKLHRDAKVSLEENGANTLYLALGFLRWYETDKSVKPRYAPLILIPVDLVRKIQDKSYSLKIRGEETQMNITLLELLRQDKGIEINGLDPIPLDEHGVDIPLVFSTVRQAIMSQKRWDIEEFAFLGQFSFSRFIMWNDIRNRADELAKNKVVASLMSGRTEWETEEEDLSPHALDEKVKPSDLAVPMSADSSQLAAIYEASLGRSFVLHGPPGTGKSQTITNMIANALFHGKSVLFVAEKMAALSVVQKRLKKLGLDPFCLELHSNKSQKRAVLSQLEEALSMTRIKSPAEYADTAERLHKLRNELNDTMSALYKERAAGMSVYDAVTGYESAKRYDGLITLGDELVKGAAASDYTAWLEAVNDMSAAGKDLGGLENSPLKNVCLTEYTIEKRGDLNTLSELLANKAADAADAYDKLGEVLGCTVPTDKEGIEKLLGLLKDISAHEMLIPCILDGSAPESVRPEMDGIIDAGLRCAQIRAEYSERFEQGVWRFDADTALINWKKVQQSGFFGKTFGSGKQVKELAVYAKDPAFVTKDNIMAILGTLCEYKQLSAMTENADPAVTKYFGELWRGGNTAFARLRDAVPASFEIRSRLGGLTPEQVSAVCRVNGGISATLNEAQIRFFDLLDVCGRMKAEFSADIVTVCGGDNFFESVKAEVSGYSGAVDSLRDRAVLENKMRSANALGLKVVTDAYRAGKVDEDTVRPAFTAAVCKSVMTGAISSEPLLKAFQGAGFERTAEKYRECTDRFSELTVAELAARLSARIPDTSSGKAGVSSELAILQKAIKSGARGMSIRKLFDSIPNLLGRLCPCMLMSPISAAQYIDPSFGKFDLVIFDEASQLPTSEAVGAIARGENVVVVGDPKQLPPTSFFTVDRTDEENFDKEDLDSVLDDCLALAMPQRHLLWHYRSRHESLIAFSNSRFYDNSLRTFPSPDDLVSKVNWVHVDGFYDKGGTKQNRAEAEAVVEEIARRLSDPVLCKDSIGVVTFNIIQQILIDDLLAERLRADPELESRANEMYEPILIKNLENVQGDERDVILFSIGYGPDKDGNVSMNFGPVNQDGGWRRLNVAISRARKEMLVFSVIRPEQIDTARSRSEGIAGLRGFLEFAAKGASALPVRNRPSDKRAENAFAEEVSASLEKLGHRTVRGIGSSDYKIDIGIVDPDNEGKYILGILCENEKNFGLTNARDRNIVQPSVLAGLGWSIAAVHILDWLDNPEKVINELEGEIKSAVSPQRDETLYASAAAPAKRGNITFEREEAPESEDSHVYAPFVPEVIGDSEYYFDNRSTSQIKRIIEATVEFEAPVSREVLLHCVLASFGMKKSAKAEARFGEIFDTLGLTLTERGSSVFVWKRSQDPSQYEQFRGVGVNGEKRKLDDVASEEISAAVVYILQTAVSLERVELVKETVKLFGAARTTEAGELAVSMGISRAVRSGKAAVDQETGRIMYVG